MTGTTLPRRISLRPLVRVPALPAARLGSIVVLLAVWEVLGRAAPLFASYPTAVVAAFIETTFVQGRLLPAFLVTFQALATGFAIATVLGILVGYAMARSRLTRTLFDPYVAALYSTPRITLIPLMIMLIGIGFELRVVMCVLSSIFPIIINTEAGVRAVPADLLDTAAAFDAGRWTTARTVTLPSALPSVFAGLRVGIIRALVGVIVAEMTAGAAGVGQLLLVFGRFFQADRLLGPVILLGLISIAMTKGISWVERRATPWRAYE